VRDAAARRTPTGERGAGSVLDCCLVVNGTVRVDKAGRAVGCRLDGQNGTIKV
jgi:hypothetical protein